MSDNQVIPDAAVEAAHEQLEAMGAYVSKDYVEAALEAAAPHLIAGALNDAADAFENLPSKEGAPIAPWDRATAVVRLRERAIMSTQAPKFPTKFGGE
jgi:hypothetical protein